jgi:glycosyltransferase involved in cell wall biosynthesis
MKISVLLPVYNAGLPLRSAIESILCQEYNEFEFLIIDDTSTDGSVEIIREYERQDSRIRAIFHSSNQGLATTLNEGLHIAGGSLVARMDQDDESLPNRLKVQCQFMTDHPEAVVAGSYVFHMGITRGKDRLVKLPTGPSQITEMLKNENCLYHPSVIIRRQEILHIGGYRREFKNAEDYDLWLRVSNRYQIANIPIPLIRYRFSVNGMTLSRKWEQLYYVILAQVAHENMDQSISVFENEACERLAKIDRSAFMKCVALGTAEELIRLGYIAECFKLLNFFSKEIGRLNAFTIGCHLFWNRSKLIQDIHAL